MIFTGPDPREPYNECDLCGEAIPAERGAFCGGDYCYVVERSYAAYIDADNRIWSND